MQKEAEICRTPSGRPSVFAVRCSIDSCGFAGLDAQELGAGGIREGSADRLRCFLDVEADLAFKCTIATVV